MADIEMGGRGKDCEQQQPMAIERNAEVECKFSPVWPGAWAFGSLFLTGAQLII